MVNTNTNYLQKKRKEIDDVPPIEVDVLPLSMDVIVDDDGGGGVQLSQVSGMTLSPARTICNTTSADGAGAVCVCVLTSGYAKQCSHTLSYRSSGSYSR